MLRVATLDQQFSTALLHVADRLQLDVPVLVSVKASGITPSDQTELCAAARRLADCSVARTLRSVARTCREFDGGPCSADAAMLMPA